MKKLVTIIASVIILGSLSTGIVSAESNTSASPVEVATNYYQSLISSSDNGQSGVPLESFNIVGVDSSNVDEVILDVQLTYEGIGQLPITPVAVIKLNGHYAIKQENVVYDMDPKSATFNEIKDEPATLNYQGAVTGGITPFSVISGSYYYNDVYANSVGFDYATTYFVGRKFSNTQKSLTLNGWQIKNSGVENISLQYGIAAVLSGGGTAELAAASTWFNGDYSSTGTWLTQYFTNVTTGSNRCVFVRNKSVSTAIVSGNVYE